MRINIEVVMKEDTEFLHALQTPASFYLCRCSVPRDLGVLYNTSQFLQYPAQGSDVLPQPPRAGFIG